MGSNHFREKTIEDAPINLNGDEAQRWCDGYNAALERTSAPELLEALRIILDGSTAPDWKQQIAITAIKKATN